MATLNVHSVGYGLMSFTNAATRKFTQEQFNHVLKNAVEACKDRPLFLNAGEFYGVPDRYENIEKLGKFFEAYPELADRAVVSIKGGVDDNWKPDTSPENLDKAIAMIDQHMAPLYRARRKLPRKLDFFCLARIDEATFEATMRYLQKQLDRGAYDKLCLSELTGPTLKWALQFVRVSLIEAEFSMFSNDSVVNGLFAEAVAHHIPVVAYSPLGKGLLAGLRPDHVAEGDVRSTYDRFRPEVWEHNKRLVDQVQAIADAKGKPVGKVALGWITKISRRTVDGVTYPEMVPIPGTTQLPRVLENLAPAELTDAEFAKLQEIVDGHETKGSRFTTEIDSLMK